MDQCLVVSHGMLVFWVAMVTTAAASSFWGLCVLSEVLRRTRGVRKAVERMSVGNVPASALGRIVGSASNVIGTPPGGNLDG
jgi:hypothetical protein